MDLLKNQSVIGVVFKEGKVLLVKRKDVPVWTLPGGGIEEGETLEEAICREIEEEAGFVVTCKRKIGEYTPINRLARFTHLFECEIVGEHKRLLNETREIAFFDINELPKMPPPYAEWVEDALKKEFFQKKLTSVSYFNFFKNLILHPVLIMRFLLSRIGIHINI